MTHRFFKVLLFGFLIAAAPGQDPFEGGLNFEPETVATVTPQSTRVEPEFYFRVAFTLNLQEHYHAYYKNAGTVGDPPSVKWDLPEGFEAGELQFPAPAAIESDGTVVYGYEGEVTFISEIEVSGELEPGMTAKITGTFNWQECAATCLEGKKDFSFEVEVVELQEDTKNHEEFFSKALEKLPQDNSAWTFEATEEENTITLEVNYPPALTVEKPIYFFSDDKQIDSQASQKVDLKEGKVVLALQRNLGNKDLFIDAGEVRDSLAGRLVFEGESGKASVDIKTPLESGADLSSVSNEPEVGFIPATEADRKAGAKLYDVNSKPEVVTLGGEKERVVTFLYGMGLLFLGGLILNLMPCVFPVLGLKVMGFVSQAGEDETKIKLHGLVFGLGLLVAMWILASVVISLGLNWGDQLANPIFLVTMIMFFFLMGLNLFGLFEIGTSLTGVGGELQGKKGFSGSFFSGVLTTLVATPCSGPFLGVAMAFALALPPVQAFAAFTVFGLGIASPYILLSFFPALIKKLPRPGAWMESFKQIMSFFLIATAVFFMDSYLKLVGKEHFNYFLYALVLIGMGTYLYGRWGNASVSRVKRMITGYGLAGVLVFGGISWAYSTAKPPEEGLAWREWYPGIVEVSRPKKRIIWVDYTADW